MTKISTILYEVLMIVVVYIAAMVLKNVAAVTWSLGRSLFGR
jgi:hypothetical protein